MKVLLFGATGLVGQSLLRQLLSRTDVSEVTALVRKTAGSNPPFLFVEHPKLKWIPFDFKAWDSVRSNLNTDVVFIALGTTIKKAGSRPQFTKIDRDLVIECAREARLSGAKTVGVVSAVGADPQSRIFYNRVKGQMEVGVMQLEFLVTVFIQPSLILGERPEGRPAEWLAQKVLGPIARLNILRGPLRLWAPVTADAIAATLICRCFSVKAESTPQVVRVQNAEI